MKQKGFLIVFEGIDACGKDTLINELFPLFFSEKLPLLISKYQEILKTREPTFQTNSGKKLIHFLNSKPLKKNQKKKRINDYINDRIRHSLFIKTFLKRNGIVLCSRYDLSTYAYQGLQEDFFEKIYKKHRYFSKKGTHIPNVTFFLKINPEQAYKRIKQRSHPKEVFDNLASLKEISKRYLKSIEFLRQKDARHIQVLNANQSKEKLIKQVIIYLKKMI